MLNFKNIVLCILFALFVGFLSAIGRKYIYPDWAASNEMIIPFIIGAVASGGSFFILYIINIKQNKKS